MENTDLNNNELIQTSNKESIEVKKSIDPVGTPISPSLVTTVAEQTSSERLLNEELKKFKKKHFYRDSSPEKQTATATMAEAEGIETLEPKKSKTKLDQDLVVQGDSKTTSSSEVIQHGKKAGTVVSNHGEAGVAAAAANTTKCDSSSEEEYEEFEYESVEEFSDDDDEQQQPSSVVGESENTECARKKDMEVEILFESAGRRKFLGQDAAARTTVMTPNQDLQHNQARLDEISDLKLVEECQTKSNHSRLANSRDNLTFLDVVVEEVGTIPSPESQTVLNKVTTKSSKSWVNLKAKFSLKKSTHGNASTTNKQQVFEKLHEKFKPTSRLLQQTEENDSSKNVRQEAAATAAAVAVAAEDRNKFNVQDYQKIKIKAEEEKDEVENSGSGSVPLELETQVDNIDNKLMDIFRTNENDLVPNIDEISVTECFKLFDDHVTNLRASMKELLKNHPTCVTQEDVAKIETVLDMNSNSSRTTEEAHRDTLKMLNECSKNETALIHRQLTAHNNNILSLMDEELASTSTSTSASKYTAGLSSSLAIVPENIIGQEEEEEEEAEDSLDLDASFENWKMELNQYNFDDIYDIFGLTKEERILLECAEREADLDLAEAETEREQELSRLMDLGYDFNYEYETVDDQPQQYNPYHHLRMRAPELETILEERSDEEEAQAEEEEEEEFDCEADLIWKKAIESYADDGDVEDNQNGNSLPIDHNNNEEIDRIPIPSVIETLDLINLPECDFYTDEIINLRENQTASGILLAELDRIEIMPSEDQNMTRILSSSCDNDSLSKLSSSTVLPINQNPNEKIPDFEGNTEEFSVEVESKPSSTSKNIHKVNSSIQFKLKAPEIIENIIREEYFKPEAVTKTEIGTQVSETCLNPNNSFNQIQDSSSNGNNNSMTTFNTNSNNSIYSEGEVGTIDAVNKNKKHGRIGLEVEPSQWSNNPSEFVEYGPRRPKFYESWRQTMKNSSRSNRGHLNNIRAGSKIYPLAIDNNGNVMRKQQRRNGWFSKRMSLCLDFISCKSCLD